MEFYRGCDCDWRPKCEALGPCGQFATVSEWRPDYSTERWRPMWLCDDHLKTWQGRPEKLNGITRPANADEYWRPSIVEHVRLTYIKNKFEEYRSAPSTSNGFTASHQHSWTKSQRSNFAAMFHSEAGREALASYHNGQAP